MELGTTSLHLLRKKDNIVTILCYSTAQPCQKLGTHLFKRGTQQNQSAGTYHYSILLDSCDGFLTHLQLCKYILDRRFT